MAEFTSVNKGEQKELNHSRQIWTNENRTAGGETEEWTGETNLEKE